MIKEIIEKLKDKISLAKGNKKVYDKDVAIFLNISYNTLAMHKSRNSTPFKFIIKACLKNNIDLNYIFKEK